ncbi:hypothetical protein AAF712_002842 [Marasmius tenuissimus]|uniref:Fe2OG dioxygenase domain-containing protein n=1 Tax=Marasmius tenuissimus TaxID=585030 RepID=A0ABR3A7I7_9AGAR
MQSRPWDSRTFSIHPVCNPNLGAAEAYHFLVFFTPPKRFAAHLNRYTQKLTIIFVAARRLRNNKEYGGLSGMDVVIDNVNLSGIIRAAQRSQESADDSDLTDLDSDNDSDEPSPKAAESRPNVDNPVFTPLAQLAGKTYVPRVPAVQKAKERSKRDKKRAKEQNVEERLTKACAEHHIQRTKSLSHSIQSNFTIPGGVWTGPKLTQDGRVYTKKEAMAAEPGMRYVPWDGTETKLVRTQEYGLALLGGRPSSPKWMEDMSEAGRLLDWAEHNLRFPKSCNTHRRGDYENIRMGISYGGGQTEPGNLVNTRHNEEILQVLRDSPAVQHVAGYADYLMKTYYKDLHTLYTNVQEKLQVDNPGLVQNFANCCFAACTFNFGKAVTRRHTDYLNLLFGMCAVLPFGNYNYEKGGHLILWDLKLVIQFPPGTIILLPSAMIEHSNVSIGKDERRSSITFYSAAGLFRWVSNGFVSDNEFRERASVKLRRQWTDYRDELWRTGLDLITLS